MKYLLQNRLSILPFFILLTIGLGNFSIAQNRRFQSVEYIVNKVYIEGNKKFTKRKIEKQLNLKEKRWTKTTTFTRRLLQLDKNALETLYVKNGYLRCTIRDSFKVNEDGYVDVFFTISEGRQYLLKDITITGNDVLDEKRLLALLNHKIGKPYNPIVIRGGIKSIIVEYANIGKPLAIVDDSLEVNDGIQLFIRIQENATLRINDIKITGNNKVKSKIIHREILLETGDLYSKEKIDLTKKRIFETGLFSSVDIRIAGIDTTSSTLNFVISVRELDMRYLGLDFGFGQDRGISEGSEPYTSLDASGEWMHRNIFRRGGRFSTKLGTSIHLTRELTRPKTEAEILYIEPWLLRLRTSTSFRIFLDNQVQQDQEVTRFGGELALIYKPDERMFFRTGAEIKGIRARIEEKNVDERDRERAIKVSFRRDFRDNFLFPSKGTLFTAAGKLVGTIFGGTQNYYKLELSYSKYINLFGTFVFAYRGKLGWMDTFTAGEEIPFYEKFYLGGETSLRGWLDRRFLTENGDPLGDDIKILTNAEIRFPLFWILGGEIFLDGGSLASDIKSLEGRPYRWDAGFGLTFSTPLGPIRVDLAKKLPIEGEQWVLQLGIPYAF